MTLAAVSQAAIREKFGERTMMQPQIRDVPGKFWPLQRPQPIERANLPQLAATFE